MSLAITPSGVMTPNIASEISQIKSLTAIDPVAQRIWRDWSLNKLTDAQAQNLAESLETQRRHLHTGSARKEDAPFSGKRPQSQFFPVKRKQPKRKDPKKSLLRRRTLAASGPLPPNLAAQFTTGELAVLRIVADEMREYDHCGLTLGEIAGRAGVSATTARNAIRYASHLGLLTIEERRQYKKPNLPNIIRLISREWLNWIHRTQKKPSPNFKAGIIGCKKNESTDISFKKDRFKRYFLKNSLKERTQSVYL